MFYTKNGLSLAVAFRGILSEPLHPTVGLRTPGEIVEANFGQKPFLFDFASEALRERSEMLSDAQTHFGDQLEAKIPQMILQFLIHHGYSKTVEAFSRSLRQSPTSQELAAIENRQVILRLIMLGDVKAAQEIIERDHPQALTDRKDIQFQLKIHRFIQMIQTETPEATILFGRRHFTFEDPLVLEHQTLLEDVFSLLAYPDPKGSPVGYLFSASFRLKLAVTVNGAILGMFPSSRPERVADGQGRTELFGKTRSSSLERCLGHSRALLAEMVEKNIPAAALCDTSWLISPTTPLKPTDMDLT